MPLLSHINMLYAHCLCTHHNVQQQPRSPHSQQNQLYHHPMSIAITFQSVPVTKTNDTYFKTSRVMHDRSRMSIAIAITILHHAVVHFIDSNVIDDRQQFVNGGDVNVQGSTVTFDSLPRSSLSLSLSVFNDYFWRKIQMDPNQEPTEHHPRTD